MGRFSALLAAVVIVLLGGLRLHAQPAVVAQEATPAGEEMAFEGISFEPLGFAPGVTAPAPTDLVLVRIGFDPGAMLPVEPEDPDGGLLLLESGTLTLRVDTPLTISRAGDLVSAIATAEATGEFAPTGEEIAPSQEVTLAAGDVVYVPGNIGGEVRNAGQERAVAMVFLLTSSSGEMGEGDAAATPTG